MGLVGHWKLDGNVEDSSLNGNHGNSGTYGFVSGKIGQALDNINSDRVTINLNKEVNKYRWSLSYWGRGTAAPPTNYNTHVKLNDSNGKYIFNFDTRTSSTPYILGYFRDSYDAAAYTTYDLLSNSEYTKWEWNHFTIVFKEESFDCYRNGEYLDTVNITVTTSGFTNIDTVIINNSDDNFETDDVRLYDHLLSEKEIKELSRAKILHYSFDNFKEYTENLANPIEDHNPVRAGSIYEEDTTQTSPCSDKVIKWTAGASDDYTSFTTADNPATVSTIYIISIYVKGDVGGESFDFYLRDNNGTDVIYAVDSFTLTPYWKRYEHSITTRSDIVILSYRFDNNVSGDTIYLSGIQFEKKDHVTPFVRGIRRARITDSSGNNNYAELDGNTPEWKEEGIIGQGCYEFNGVDQYTKTLKTGLFNVDTTISWREKDFSTDSKIPFSIGSYKNNGIYVHRNTTINISVIPTGTDDSLSISGLMATTNEWNYYTIVYIKSTLFFGFYKNGVLESSKTLSNEIIPSTNNIFLGTYNASSSWMCDCMIDDFRIYSTALSQTEIQELYQQRASIDKEGNFYLKSIREYYIPEDNMVLYLDSSNKSSYKYKTGKGDRDHGLSSWVCVESGTATYSAIYPNTNIYSIDQSGNTSTVLSDLNNSRGTFTINYGYKYFSNNPIYLMDEGEQHRLIPETLKGHYFGSVAIRNSSSTFYVYCPDGSGTVYFYDNVTGGVDGTATSSQSISKGEIKTFSTSNTGTWSIFYSTIPVIMSTTQTGADRMLLTPASQYVYRRRDGYERTIRSSIPSTVLTSIVSDNDLCFSVEIGDGAGGDSCEGMGYENLSNIYSWGNVLSDYDIVTPYADNEINVYYYSSGSWILGESHFLDGSISSPASAFRDGTVGFGSAGSTISGAASNLASGANLWKFVGKYPFLLTINDSSDDEEPLLGWMGDRIDLNKWFDLSNFENNGTLMGGADYRDGAIFFDGVDDYIEIPRITLYKESSTISFWVKVYDFTGHMGYSDGVAIVNDSSTNAYKYISMLGNQITMETNTNSPIYHFYNTFNENTWYNITFTFSGSSAQMYVDGSSVGSSQTINDNIDFNRIGMSLLSNYYAEWFDGLIFNMLVYHRALTEEEVKNVYNVHKNKLG